MNLSKQIKTTKKEALAFVNYMKDCGYTVHEEKNEYAADYSFSKDGKITINYGVYIVNGGASFIMVRA